VTIASDKFLSLSLSVVTGYYWGMIIMFRETGSPRWLRYDIKSCLGITGFPTWLFEAWILCFWLTQGVKYYSRCEISFKVWNINQGVKYYPRCEILSKVWNTTEGVKYHSRCEILSTLWNTTPGVKYYLRCETSPKVWNTTLGVKYYPRCEILPKVWNTI